MRWLLLFLLWSFPAWAVQVDITSPLPGEVFTEGDPVTITVQASDETGAVTSVEGFVDGVSIGQCVPTGFDWECSWVATPGNHDISAIATADLLSSMVSVVVDEIPPPPPPDPSLNELDQYIVANPGPSGAWRQIANSRMTEVLTGQNEYPWCDTVRCDNAWQEWQQWVDFAWDGLCWWMPAAGGHKSVGLNETYRWCVGGAWERVIDPQPLDPNKPLINTDGSPHPTCIAPVQGPPATHNYDGVIFVASTGKIVYLGAYPYCASGGSGAVAWDLDTQALTWLERPEFYATPRGRELPRFAKTDIDNLGNVIVSEGGIVWIFDPVTYEVLGQSGNAGWISHATGTFHQALNEFFMITEGVVWRSSLVDINPTTPVRTFHPEILQKDWGADVRDSTGDIYISNRGDTVLVYDPDTDTIEILPAAPSAPPGVLGRVYGQWQYVPEKDVFLLFTGPMDNPADTTEGVWVYTPPDHQGASLPPESSFASKCAEAGVILCTGFDSTPATGSGVKPDANPTTLVGALAVPNNRFWWISDGPLRQYPPIMDSTVFASGDGSLRFTIGSESNAGGGGSTAINFSSDASEFFRPGETLWFQMKVLHDTNMLFDGPDHRRYFYRNCDPATVLDGTCDLFVALNKWWILGVGDQDQTDPNHKGEACTGAQIVGSQAAVDHAPGGYTACTGTVAFRQLREDLPSGGSKQYDQQPGGDNQCLRSHDDGAKREWGDPDPDCRHWVRDQWQTLTVRIDLGDPELDFDGEKGEDGKYLRLADPRISHVEMWLDDFHFIDHDFFWRGPKTKEYDAWPEQALGKLWLMCRATKKSPDEIHPNGHCWFDELIISRNPITV